MTNEKPDSGARGGLKGDLLLVVAVMGLVLGAVGTFLAFQNKKDVDGLSTDLKFAKDAIAQGDEVLGTTAERLTTIEKAYGLAGQDPDLDVLEQFRLLRRDVAELNKRVTRFVEAEVQLRGKLGPVVEQLEAMDNRLKKLERMGVRRQEEPDDGPPPEKPGIPRPGEDEGK